jgi:hypothetical protein
MLRQLSPKCNQLAGDDDDVEQEQRVLGDNGRFSALSK